MGQENLNYITNVNLAFIDSNPLLKYYLTMVKTQTLQKQTSVHLIISNNSDNKICIPKNTSLGSCKAVNSNH